MGSHTWTHKKIDNVPSDEVMFKYFTKVTYDDGDSKRGYWEEKDLLIDLLWSKTHYKNWQKEGINKEIQDVQDYSKVPEEIKHLCYPNDCFFEIPEADFNIQWDEFGTYIECGIHDPFRIYGYPDVRLHSYEDCVKFINSEEVIEGSSELPSDYTQDYFLTDRPKAEILEICKKLYEEYPGMLIYFG